MATHDTAAPPSAEDCGAEEAFRDRFLGCRLGEHTYGLEMARVREILGLQPITPVAGTPPFIRGVINLRGHVLPLLDVRRRLGLPPRADDPHTCIVTVQARDDLVGLIVDRVSHVLTVPPAHRQPRERLPGGDDQGLVGAVGRTEGGVVELLDVDRVVEHEAKAARRHGAV